MSEHITKKEFVIDLARAYYNHCCWCYNMCDALQEHGVYISEINDPMISDIEKLLNKINPVIVDCILDIVNTGSSTFYETKDGDNAPKEVSLQTIEDIIECIM